ncbi:MAG: response regulator transcription factor [Chloroflexota bacterium]|nr:MAG: response regulator transcription factor [Chloroflexota bacterium]
MTLESNTDAIRVLLVDDHDLFREGVKAMLQRHKHIDVVGEARNGFGALEQARKLMPDVVLLDVRMPGCNGLTVLGKMQKELPAVKVVMLTISEDDEDLFAAVRAGARGYVLKTIEPEGLVKAIEQVSRGEAVISPAVAVKLLNEFAALGSSYLGELDGDTPELTNREKEVLELVAQGLGNKEIAKALTIAERTVKSHLHNVVQKLQLHNRAEAAAYIVRSKMAHARARKGPHDA